MVMRTKMFLLIIFIPFLILFRISYAISISCDSCIVGDCRCSITDCQNGTLDVYSTSYCTKIENLPIYAFTDGSINQSPTLAGTYYIKIFCDDGSISECIALSVDQLDTTTTEEELISPEEITSSVVTTVVTTTIKATSTMIRGLTTLNLILVTGTFFSTLVIGYVFYIKFLKKKISIKTLPEKVETPIFMIEEELRLLKKIAEDLRAKGYDVTECDNELVLAEKTLRKDSKDLTIYHLKKTRELIQKF